MAARKKKPAEATRAVLVQLGNGNPDAQLHTSVGPVRNHQGVTLPDDEAALYIERGLAVEPDE